LGNLDSDLLAGRQLRSVRACRQEELNTSKETALNRPDRLAECNNPPEGE